MAKFEYQKLRKKESELKVMRALLDGNKTFTDLLSLTKLSKPVLTERLKEMMSEGKIDKDLNGPWKQFIYYKPTGKLLTSDDMKRVFFYRYSMDKIFKEVEKAFKNKSLSDEDCLRLLSKKINALTLYNYFLYASMEPKQGQKWLVSYFSNLRSMLIKLSKDRLKGMKKVLVELYPEETALLDDLKREYMTEEVA